MSMEQLLNLTACIALIVFGMYAIVQPEAAAALAHLKADDATALAEVRTAFGAPALGMGAAGLIVNQPVAYQAIGIVWLAIFAVRLVATYKDRPQLVRTYIMSGVFEVVIGLILVLA